MQVERTAAAPVAVQTAAKPAGREDHAELVRAVRALNRVELYGPRRELAFSVDRLTHRPVIRIMDKETGEVLQQIPEQYVLDRAAEYKTTNNQGL